VSRSIHEEGATFLFDARLREAFAFLRFLLVSVGGVVHDSPNRSRERNAFDDRTIETADRGRWSILTSRR
jgi:hypothetical protein